MCVDLTDLFERIFRFIRNVLETQPFVCLEKRNKTGTLRGGRKNREKKGQETAIGIEIVREIERRKNEGERRTKMMITNYC